MPAQSDITRDFLVARLRDAHAMESQALAMMTGQADRLRHYPALEARIRQHYDETEAQLGRVEACLTRLGSGRSGLMDTAMQTVAGLQSMLHGLAGDEVIKSSLASFAFENFEIATYTALIEAARLAGEPEIEATCRRNLEEEERMAAFLGQGVPQLVRQYLDRSAAGVEARR